MKLGVQLKVGNLINVNRDWGLGKLFRKVAEEVLHWNILQCFTKINTNAKHLTQNTSTDQCIIYNLPDGWTKRMVQRQGGVSVGKWDTYLIPPSELGKRQIRSVVELSDFLVRHPHVRVDPQYVNFQMPMQSFNSSTRWQSLKIFLLHKRRFKISLY